MKAQTFVHHTFLNKGSFLTLDSKEHQIQQMNVTLNILTLQAPPEVLHLSCEPFL